MTLRQGEGWKNRSEGVTWFMLQYPRWDLGGFEWDLGGFEWDWGVLSGIWGVLSGIGGRGVWVEFGGGGCL